MAGSAFWAEGLLAHLEKLAPGTGFSWVADCIINAVEKADPPYAEKVSGWVRKLVLAADDAIVTDLLKDIEAIWYERDNQLNKAVSHLFAAKTKLLQGDDPFYKYHLLKSMMFLGSDEYCRRSAATIPLALFDRYVP